jgi:filamin
LVSSKITDNNDGTYKVIYKPNDVGRYLVNVNYGGIPVNNSPFSVKVEPTGDPTKCHVSGRSCLFVFDCLKYRYESF